VLVQSSRSGDQDERKQEEQLSRLATFYGETSAIPFAAMAGCTRAVPEKVSRNPPATATKE